MNNNKFDKLYSLNVNDKVEIKDNGKIKLKYLSWSWAYAEFKKVYPDFTYEIKTFGENKLPYQATDLGIMVWTSITADSETREMWLPVMDGANRPLKLEPYTLKTKYGDVYVNSATMFDINKTIMRCLVKNMALFGLGLYIYSGEDLPENNNEEIVEENKELIQDFDVLVDKINNCKSIKQLVWLKNNHRVILTDDERKELTEIANKKNNELKTKLNNNFDIK